MARTPFIRVATASDVPTLDHMFRELDRYHMRLAPDVFRTSEGSARDAAWMTKVIEDPRSDILIARREQGFVHVAEAVTPDLPMFRPDRWLSIENLYVGAAYRRQGLGRALIHAAYDWGRKRNLTKARLGVWYGNSTARAFYESLGYQELKVTLEAVIAPENDTSVETS
jgi:GNAT superfamily N-acetyltransferase